MAATLPMLDTLPSIDPATGKVLRSFERTSPLAVPQLVAKARAAQQSWAKRPAEERCAQVAELKTKILETSELLTGAVVRESGKNIRIPKLSEQPITSENSIALGLTRREMPTANSRQTMNDPWWWKYERRK